MNKELFFSIEKNLMSMINKIDEFIDKSTDDIQFNKNIDRFMDNIFTSDVDTSILGDLARNVMIKL